MKIVHDVQSSKRSLLSVNVAVCVSATLMLNKLSDLGFASNSTLSESAYDASIGDVIDDVT